MLGALGLLIFAHPRCDLPMTSPQACRTSRSTRRFAGGMRVAAITAIASALVVSGGIAAPAQASTKPIVKAPTSVVTQIAETLEIEARCLTVRLARSWRVWAWAIPNYRIGCDHQLDTAVILAKQVSGEYATTGIEGAPLICETLKREMSLYVEDDEPRIGKRTMKAFRNFKAAGICVKE